MIGSRRKWFALAVAVCVLFCLAQTSPCAGKAETKQEAKGAAKIAVPSLKEAVSAVKAEDVNKVRKKISAEVHGIEKIVSSCVGPWAGHHVVGPTSLVTIISTMILLILVIVVERVLRLIIWAVLRRLSRRKTEPSRTVLVLEALSKPLSLFVFTWGVYLALAPLLEDFRRAGGSKALDSATSSAAELLSTIAVLWLVFRIAQAVVTRLEAWARTTEGGVDDMLVRLFGTATRVLIIIVGGLFVLQNLTGVQIGPLIASLGIGGLAFALAAKDSIANVFGTVTIMLDKPFLVGDRVKIGDFDGAVENVGYRSTRIRTLDGHLVSIPNQTVMNASLENVSQRRFLKWSTNLTLTYDTPLEKIERAVQIMREILENHEGMRADQPPRVFFNALNDWNLGISVTAWYFPPDLWAYQDWVQKTCLEVLRRFGEEGIDFAFPTQTVFLADDEKRRLKLEMIRGDDIAA
jgi:MscS family membrane protein